MAWLTERKKNKCNRQRNVVNVNNKTKKRVANKNSFWENPEPLATVPGTPCYGKAFRSPVFLCITCCILLILFLFLQW